MSYYHGNSIEDWRAYRRQQKYFETTYDRNSPYEQMKRERSRINIMITGLDNSGLGLDPELKSCKWCHEVLIPVDDGASLMCQGCGLRSPTTSTSSNDSSSSNNDKGKPTLPKESKFKLKQKDSLENKSFVITQSDDQRRDRDRARRSTFEEETEEDLGALNFLSRLYGNVGDY
jgi:hypothetical protein